MRNTQENLQQFWQLRHMKIGEIHEYARTQGLSRIRWFVTKILFLLN